MLNILLFAPNARVSASLVPVSPKQSYPRDIQIDDAQDPKTGYSRSRSAITPKQDGIEKRYLPCGYVEYIHFFHYQPYFLKSTCTTRCDTLTQACIQLGMGGIRVMKSSAARKVLIVLTACVSGLVLGLI